MAGTADLIARLLARRERWIEIEPGRELLIRRPAEAELNLYIRGIGVEQLGKAVVGWSGFTEADVLGPTQGSTSAVPFDQALCIELLRDRVEWIGKLADALMDDIRAHLESREAARKN